MADLLVLIEMANAELGGCIFCSEQGSGEHITSFYKNENTENPIEYIKKQIDYYFKSYKSERANKFIAYFQNYTNTYDSPQKLKQKYEAALSQNNKIVALDVATRPDCITEEICQLLASFKNKYEIFVELGLQTSNDNTANIINRGYPSSLFSKTLQLLNKYHIETIVHIMIGLPNETHKDLQKTIEFLNNHKFKGIKIHSCYIIKNTKLAQMYYSNQYQPLKLEYYIQEACYVLTHISPEIIIHKISGDAPKNLLIAPDWNSHKKLILNGINKYMKENNLYQGKFFSNSI